MKYIRIIFLIQTALWSFGAVAALMDRQVTSLAAKLAVLITAGSLFKGSDWQYAGVTKSQRVSAHGRLIRKWKFVGV